MHKNIPLLLALIFFVPAVQAQENPPDVQWESDPLDVIEQPQVEEEPVAMPEFQDVPVDAEASASPKPEVTPDVAAPKSAESPEAVSSSEAASSPPISGAEPDLDLENRFHTIYKSYNQQPTATETWEQVVGTRKSEIYQVQKGDTLSGISTTFFGDFQFWPKIWSLNNAQILNPHEITPGMNVQFFPGSMDEAPTLTLAENKIGAVGEPASTEAAPMPEATQKEISSLIPAAKKRSAILKNIPPSLPNYSVGSFFDQGVDFKGATLKLPEQASSEYLTYYIADEPIRGVGIVVAGELDMTTAGDFQYIYVRLDSGSGKDFYVQKNLSQVPDPIRKERRAQMIEIQGQIELLEKVNDKNNTYRAIVKKAIQPVEVGSVITPGFLPMIDTSPRPVTPGATARIMGGQYDRKRSLFGSNSLVFLDSGTSQGLQVGQNLPIFADESIRNKKALALMNDRVIGAIKIVRVSANFATGYVTKSSDDILMGDYIGKSTFRASNQTVDQIEEDRSRVMEDSTDNFEKEFDSVPVTEPTSESGFDDTDF